MSGTSIALANPVPHLYLCSEGWKWLWGPISCCIKHSTYSSGRNSISSLSYAQIIYYVGWCILYGCIWWKTIFYHPLTIYWDWYSSLLSNTNHIYGLVLPSCRLVLRTEMTPYRSLATGQALYGSFDSWPGLVSVNWLLASIMVDCYIARPTVSLRISQQFTWAPYFISPCEIMTSELSRGSFPVR